jgi:hypothetical protein
MPPELAITNLVNANCASHQFGAVLPGSELPFRDEAYGALRL